MRVEHARERMLVRQRKTNVMLDSSEINEFCAMDDKCKLMVKRAIEKLGLSARSYHRTLKVARSIADIAGSDHVRDTHLAEALGYRRRLDEGFGARRD